MVLYYIQTKTFGASDNVLTYAAFKAYYKLFLTGIYVALETLPSKTLAYETNRQPGVKVAAFCFRGFMVNSRDNAKQRYGETLSWLKMF